MIGELSAEAHERSKTMFSVVKRFLFYLIAFFQSSVARYPKTMAILCKRALQPYITKIGHLSPEVL
jgi:hypothetical protein